MKNMKINKTLLLALALTAACCAQPAFGMHLVTKGMKTAQKNLKPLAYVTGAVTVATTGYVIWKKYTQQPDITRTQINQDQSRSETIAEQPATRNIIRSDDHDIETINQLYQQPEIAQETPREYQAARTPEIQQEPPVTRLTSEELKQKLKQHMLKSDIDEILTMLGDYVAITIATCKTMRDVWTPTEILTDGVCAKFLHGLRGGHQSTLQTFMELRKELTDYVPLKEHLERTFIAHEKINAQFTNLNCMDKHNRTRIVKQFTNIIYKEIMDKQF